VSVNPIGGNNVQIYVWNGSIPSIRLDLATPLSESGTGIGQVLAILYAVMTAKYSTTIIIDEPQSFLHPGAVRKLFEILREHDEHQYIVTTHSPIAISSAEPSTMLLVRKHAAESAIEEIDVSETQQLRSYLSEIGASLADVFGADEVLWVEGPTEERCFPIILTEVAKAHILATAIVSVLHTGDFDGKRVKAKTLVNIYEKLTRAKTLLPPSIGFIFDREDRTQRERDELESESGQKIRFIQRRTFENYLLIPDAIAHVITGLDETRSSPVTSDEVQDWLDEHGWDDRYFKPKIPESQQSLERWVTDVRGGLILQDLFSCLTQQRIEYRKAEYGPLLTSWIATNRPGELSEIATLISEALNRRRSQ
jgi:hypothetical protein